MLVKYACERLWILPCFAERFEFFDTWKCDTVQLTRHMYDVEVQL